MPKRTIRYLVSVGSALSVVATSANRRMFSEEQITTILRLGSDARSARIDEYETAGAGIGIFGSRLFELIRHPADWIGWIRFSGRPIVDSSAGIFDISADLAGSL